MIAKQNADKILSALQLSTLEDVISFMMPLFGGNDRFIIRHIVMDVCTCILQPASDVMASPSRSLYTVFFGPFFSFIGYNATGHKKANAAYERRIL